MQAVSLRELFARTRQEYRALLHLEQLRSGSAVSQGHAAVLTRPAFPRQV
jgi:hypothetical protein